MESSGWLHLCCRNMKREHKLWRPQFTRSLNLCTTSPGRGNSKVHTSFYVVPAGSNFTFLRIIILLLSFITVFKEETLIYGTNCLQHCVQVEVWLAMLASPSELVTCLVVCHILSTFNFNFRLWSYLYNFIYIEIKTKTFLQNIRNGAFRKLFIRTIQVGNLLPGSGWPGGQVSARWYQYLHLNTSVIHLFTGLKIKTFFLQITFT